MKMGVEIIEVYRKEHGTDGHDRYLPTDRNERINDVREGNDCLFIARGVNRNERNIEQTTNNQTKTLKVNQITQLQKVFF